MPLPYVNCSAIMFSAQIFRRRSCANICWQKNESCPKALMINWPNVCHREHKPLIFGPLYGNGQGDLLCAIHILLCRGVSRILLHDADLVDSKGGKYFLRPQAHRPFRWHHGGSFDVKVGRRLVHRNLGRKARMKNHLDVTILYCRLPGQQPSEEGYHLRKWPGKLLSGL